MEFKNYKEKQAFYKQRVKESKTFWESGVSRKNRQLQNQHMQKYGSLITGRTYVKKENE